MGSIGDRLREEREQLGYTQAELSVISGQSRKTQIRYESGERSPDGDYLAKIASAGVDVLYVLTGEKSVANRTEQAIATMRSILADPSEFAQIPVYDAAMAAGGGRINEGEAMVVSYIAFTREYLRQLGVSARTAAIVQSHGDSMSPTIEDGEPVLIDRAQVTLPQRPRDPRDARKAPIFSLLDDGLARFKRVEFVNPQSVLLVSDNAAYPPELRPIEAITPLGRAFVSVRALGE